MNNDLISREALKKAINELGIPIYGKMVLKAIDNAPTVDIKKLVLIVAKRSGKREMMLNALRPQGEWNVDGCLIACNKCGRILLKASELYNFCPNCGADMRKGESE